MKTFKHTLLTVVALTTLGLAGPASVQASDATRGMHRFQSQPVVPSHRARPATPVPQKTPRFDDKGVRSQYNVHFFSPCLIIRRIFPKEDNPCLQV